MAMPTTWMFLIFGLFVLLHPEDFGSGLASWVTTVVWRLRGFAIGTIVVLLLKAWAEGTRLIDDNGMTVESSNFMAGDNTAAEHLETIEDPAVKPIPPPEELVNVKLSFGAVPRPKQKSVSHVAKALSKKHWARIRSDWGDTSKVGSGTPVRKHVEAAGHMGYTWLKPAKA